MPQLREAEEGLQLQNAGLGDRHSVFELSEFCGSRDRYLERSGAIFVLQFVHTNHHIHSRSFCPSRIINFSCLFSPRDFVIIMQDFSPA